MATPSDKLNSVCCIGAGYVGAITMCVIAKHCPHLTIKVVDINQKKIDAWNSDHLPIFEPFLQDLVVSQRGKNLFFSTDVDGGISTCDIIFIAVDTATKQYGVGGGIAYDLTSTEVVARKIASVARSNKIIVQKSTVPVKTAERLTFIMESNKSDPSIHFEMVSNPEFLAEGQAIHNLEKPSRVVIGSFDTPSGLRAAQVVRDIYRNWVPDNLIVITNIWSSELAKLAANALLAQRISSINAISALCEKTGAHVDEVAKVMGMDPRLGPFFLQTSIGFGGSCFRKDINGLSYLCDTEKLPEVAEYWRQINFINEYQKERIANLIISSMFGSLRGKKICLLGFAFKKNTGDIRESPAIAVSKILLEEGAKIVVYDPKVQLGDIHDLGGVWTKITSSHDPYAATAESHAVVIITDWDEFTKLDWKRIYAGMVKPAFVFDGRNIMEHSLLTSIGFQTYSIGKPFAWVPGPATVTDPSATSF